MKPHLVLTFQPGIPVPPAPDWVAVIERGAQAPDRTGRPVDELFRRYRLSVKVTREYPAAGGSFSDAEVRAGLDRVYRIILQENTDLPDALLDAISLLPDIEAVRRGVIGSARLPEPGLARAASFDETAQELIFLKQAHLLTQGHPDITVAVLDTGVCLSHPELRHALVPGHDFVNIINGADQFIGDYLGYDAEPDDEVGHGTHVAGIIAGRGLKMPKGVAPRCRIMPLRVLGAMKAGDKNVGAGLVDNINTAIKWAVDNGADVINMSLGVKHEGGGLPHAEVVQYALEKGVTIVAASGNDGRNDKYYPGALPGVLAVGAVDERDEMAPFSTWGGHVSLVAPGTNILSSFLTDSYAVCSGTSQAAPFVAGAVALLKSYAREAGGRLRDSQVKYLLKHTSDRKDSRLRTDRWGYGRVNILDALKLLQYMQSQLN